MICVEVAANGTIRAVYPQPVDFSTCSLVVGSYSELSADLFQITPAQGAEIGGSILLIWAIAWAFRMVVRSIVIVDERNET